MRARGTVQVRPASETRDYENAKFKIRLRLPRDWQRVRGSEERLGKNGEFVAIGALAAGLDPGGGELSETCRGELNHPDRRHGERPRLEQVTIDGRPGCRIRSSEPVSSQERGSVTYVLAYPHPVTIPLETPGVRRREADAYPFLSIWIDEEHSALVEKHLRFVRS